MPQSDTCIYILIIWRRGRESQICISHSWQNPNIFKTTGLNRASSWTGCIWAGLVLFPNGGGQYSIEYSQCVEAYFTIRKGPGYTYRHDPTPLSKPNKSGIFSRPGLPLVFQNACDLATQERTNQNRWTDWVCKEHPCSWQSFVPGKQNASRTSLSVFLAIAWQ